MTRRNSLRSWLTASLLLLSSMAGVLAAPSPAGAVDNNRWLVWVSDAGFSQKLIKATVGDQVTFQLDLQNANTQHTVTWDRGHVEVELTREKPSFTFPMNSPGKAYYWDRYHIQGPNADAFIGTLEVAAAPPPPPSSTTSSSTSTTVTTAPTTTSTMPTTTTTAPTAIRPQLISDPPSTTTTVAVPQPPSPPRSGSPAPAGDKKDKDKGKGKAASTQTPTTTAPAPPEAPALELIFDPASLTPGPTMIPEPFTDTTDAAALDAAAAASLLDAPKAEDDGSKLMLMALGGLTVLLLLGGGWSWFNRASRYDPA